MICLGAQAFEVPETATGHEILQDRRHIMPYGDKIVQCPLMGEYTKSGRQELA